MKNKEPYFCAIDPGSKPALALITAETRVLTAHTREEMFEIMRKLPSNTVVGIEDVHAIFGVGATSTFQFGMNTGFWHGIFEFLDFAVYRISVPKWQAACTEKPIKPDIKGLSKSEIVKFKKIHKESLKMESYRAAQLAFPDCRFPSHDVADAVNMARYLRMQYRTSKLIEDNEDVL